MTKDKDFKRIVRARMASTGEHYTEARQHLEADRAEVPSWVGANVLFRAALQKAAALGHHWAGEEHVLLSLLEAAETLAGRALATAGFTYEAAASTLDSYLARSGPPVPRRYSGTSSEASYHSVLGRAEGLALGLGRSAAGPEHALLALVWQVGGRVDQLLQDLSSSREALFSILDELGVGVPIPPPMKPVPNPLLAAAKSQADQLGYSFIYQDHVVMALLAGEPDDLAQRVLHDCGLTYDSWATHLLEEREGPSATTAEGKG